MAEGLLQDKVIIITGGAQGIGRECSRAYAREGASVVIADINKDAAVQTVSELGGDGFAVHCDVGDVASVQKAVSDTLGRFSRIDAVHNNAGIVGPSKHLHETTEKEWDDLERVNLKSVYLTTRCAFDALKKSKGCILNTASMVGLIGQDNHAAYVATKGGIVALTKAMAVDYAPFGIRVNSVCPAGVRTPMVTQWIDEQPDRVLAEKHLDDIHLLGKCPEGDVIADAAVFLLSEKARFITGCNLPVSGGAELGYRR